LFVLKWKRVVSVLLPLSLFSCGGSHVARKITAMYLNMKVSGITTTLNINLQKQLEMWYFSVHNNSLKGHMICFLMKCVHRIYISTCTWFVLTQFIFYTDFICALDLTWFNYSLKMPLGSLTIQKFVFAILICKLHPSYLVSKICQANQEC